MAVRADNRVWVHLAHPSGLNGHFKAWLETEAGPGKKRKKRLLARNGVDFASRGPDPDGLEPDYGVGV
jgi:hypothetical protein